MSDSDRSIDLAGPYSVLIVDDDEDVRHVLDMLFDIEGFEVVGKAATGIEGVTLAVRHQPDFVILDQMMPGFTGERTAQMLKVVVPGVKIVAFSAHLGEVPEWADAYLSKDRIDGLVSLLSGLISASSSTPPVAS